MSIPAELRALETGLFDLEQFLEVATSTGFEIQEDLLRVPPGQDLDPEHMVGTLADAFSKSFKDLNPGERTELRKLASRDLLRLTSDSSVMEVESGFINLANLFVRVPLVRWKEQLPDDSLPPRLVLAPKVQDLILSKTQDSEQLAAMAKTILTRPLTGRFALEEEQKEALDSVVGMRWTGQRPLSAHSLVQAVGKTRVRRLIDAGALSAPSEGFWGEGDENTVPEMIIRDSVKKRAQEEELDLLQLVSTEILSVFQLADGLAARLKLALEACGLGKGKDSVGDVGPLSDFLITQTSGHLRGERARESKQLLAHRLQRTLVEKGPFEIRLIPKEQAPIVTRNVKVVTLTKDFRLKDGSPNRQLFIRTLTDLYFPRAGVVLRDHLENPELLEAKTGRLMDPDRLLDEAKETLGKTDPLRSSTNELILEQLRSKKIVDIQTMQVRERLASSGLELSLARLPLEEKVRDLDGTNLGSFGSEKDVAEVMLAWSQIEASHFDVATTLQTLYEKGRMEIMEGAVKGPWLKGSVTRTGGQSGLLVVSRVILEQVLAGAEASRLGDISLSRDCLMPFAQVLGEKELLELVQGLMGFRGDNPMAENPNDRRLLAGFFSAVLMDASVASPELVRGLRHQWLMAFCGALENLMEAGRKGKGPLVFGQNALLQVLGLAESKALKQVFPSKPHQGLLPTIGRLFKPMTSLSEQDTQPMTDLASFIKKLGYAPQEPALERIILLSKRYRPELWKDQGTGA